MVVITAILQRSPELIWAIFFL